MMLKNIFLFFLAMLLLDAADPFKGKIKSIHMDQWPDTLSYQYDKEGQEYTRSSSSGLKTIYTYSGHTIIAKTGGDVITMFLNSRGLVDSLTDIDTNRKTTVTHQEGFPDNEMFSFGGTRIIPYLGNHTLELDEIAGVTSHSLVSFSKRFIYDDAGYIKMVRVHLSSSRQIVCTNVVENGNIISYSVRYPVDTIEMLNPKTKAYETKIVRQNDFIVKNAFDADKRNTLMVNPFLGKSSKNLIIRSVKYDMAPGLPADSNVTTFKYTLDPQGQVLTLITKVKTNDPPEEKVYSERPDTCSFTYY